MKLYLTKNLTLYVGLLMVFSSVAFKFNHHRNIDQHTIFHKKIKIAIIDTGVDINHTFLQDSLWVNPGESGIDNQGRLKSVNNIDDDGNGLVDDVNGWNFASNTNDVKDYSGHGTHIAGIIKTNILNINANVDYEFMILKYYNKGINGREQEKSFLKALSYAIDMGVDIINVSAGGRSRNSKEAKLLQKAKDKGITIVAAAGNKRELDKDQLFYPAAYEYSNIISVVATNMSGKILGTSNQNYNKWNTFENGSHIYSSLPNNKFGYMTGSSQATAAVTAKMACQEYESVKNVIQRLHSQRQANVRISSKLLHNL
ncbi:MAG: S8 family serine peptidase [Bdellovibrionales bacterium]|nr:S8 family serine peptidase [Bdellovibrionales bacterium]